MNRKISILVIGVVLIIVTAVVISSALFAHSAQASLWDDLLNLFGENSAPIATSSVPAAPKPEVPLYKPALDYEQAIIHAVEAGAPSVVSIVISKDLPVIEQCPGSPFGNLPPEFRDFFGQDFQFSVPCEKGTKRQEVGGGTGFFVSADGLILTNKHVVADAKADYTVLTNDGKKHDAKVLARDPVNDLAIIKVEGSGFKSATVGDSDSVKLGQTAIAIGNALGEFRNTVSVGVVSGLARTVTASGQGIGTETIQGVIQTDAAINPGNSGGPLLNLKGEVIAINTAMASGAQSIGFAIPINQAKRAIESVKRTGSIKTPYIGVRYLLINEDVKVKQKLPVDYGALVRGTEDGPGVIPDSPAAKAGIQAEDIILEIGGVKIDTEHSLSSLIQRYNVGDTVNVKIRRGDKELTLPVTLGERPAE
ncbi:MAG: trypsin-like peptidase domain-containing protein [Candidatus Jorgensenbacteria bacterium]